MEATEHEQEWVKAEEFFSTEEIERLVEALDAWVTKDSYANLVTSMIPMLAPPGVDRAAAAREAEKEKQRLQFERNIRKEAAVLLQAKLLKLKNGIRN